MEMENTDFVKEAKRLKSEVETFRNAIEKSMQTTNAKTGENYINAYPREDMLKLQKALQSQLTELSEQLEETEAALTDAIERSEEKQLEAIAVDADDINEKISELKEMLEQKAERKSIQALHQRFSVMLAVNVVSLGGIFMLLGLFCYLIFSLAR